MRCFVILICLLFFGCMRIPKKDTCARLSPPVSVDETLEESLEESMFTQGEWPDCDWWKMFDDPNLARMIENVLGYNPTMHAAEMHAKAALQEAYIVRSALFPHLNFDTDFNWQHLSKENLYRIPPSLLPAVIYQLALGLELTYDFDIWGKNRQRFAAALGEAKAKVAETAQVHLLLSTTTASNYIDLQSNMEKEKLAVELLEKEQKLLDLTIARYENGLADLRIVNERRARVRQIDQRLIQTHERVILGKNFILALMGDSPDADLAMIAPSATFNQPFPLPEHLSLDLLARRPDVSVKVWEVERSAHLIGAAKALFYPDLNLRMLGGYQSLSWTRWFSPESLAGSFNPAIHLPIFVGGKLRANLSARVAQFEHAVYEYNETLVQAAKDVADKITEVESATKQSSDQSSVIEDISNVYDITFARARSGLDDQLDLLQREIELIDSQIEMVEINDHRLKNIVGLIKALGGGYHDLTNKQQEWAEDAAKQ